VKGENRLASGDTTMIPGKEYIVATNPESSDELVRLMRG